MTVARIYVRVSTEDQAEHGHSLEAQERILIERCKREGWPCEVYREAGVSGETVEGRPAFRRLLADLQTGDYVLVTDLDRLSRNLLDLATIVNRFASAGVRIVMPHQTSDPRDLHQLFQLHIRGAVAGYEKALIVERTLRGKLEKARKGGWPAGRVPYGFRKDGHTILVNGERRDVLHRIRDMVLDRGMGAGAIGLELGSLGIPNPHGGRRWGRTTVRKIIMGMMPGGVYTGRGHYNVLKRYGKTLRPRPESERVPVEFPRIVSDDDAGRMGERFRKISELSMGKTTHQYLLRGLVRCGECGRAMSAYPIHGEPYHRCTGKNRAVADPPCKSRSVRASFVEALVWNQVRAMLSDPGTILEEARRWRESRISNRDDLEMRIAYIDRALPKIPEERQSILTAWHERWPGVSEDETKCRLADLERKRERLEEERRQITARLSLEQADEQQAVRLDAIAKRAGQRLERLTYEEKFDLIHSFVERVTVHKDRTVQIRAFVPVPTPAGGVSPVTSS